ncbi:MAG TPA: methionyl-tRNA formyltransferase, partial [Casimicrobiaceae bacterium]
SPRRAAASRWRRRPGRSSPRTAPGTVFGAGEVGIDVACGDEGIALRITELQPAGGKRMPAADYLRGRAVTPGMRFELPR